MTRDWRLIAWSANAGLAVGGILFAVRFGDAAMSLFEGLMLGFTVHIVRGILREDK